MFIEITRSCRETPRRRRYFNLNARNFACSMRPSDRLSNLRSTQLYPAFCPLYRTSSGSDLGDLSRSWSGPSVRLAETTNRLRSKFVEDNRNRFLATCSCKVNQIMPVNVAGLTKSSTRPQSNHSRRQHCLHDAELIQLID